MLGRPRSLKAWRRTSSTHTSRSWCAPSRGMRSVNALPALPPAHLRPAISTPNHGGESNHGDARLLPTDGCPLHVRRPRVSSRSISSSCRASAGARWLMHDPSAPSPRRMCFLCLACPLHCAWRARCTVPGVPIALCLACPLHCAWRARCTVPGVPVALCPACPLHCARRAHCTAAGVACSSPC
jgi:hypothetical protein